MKRSRARESGILLERMPIESECLAREFFRQLRLPKRPTRSSLKYGEAGGKTLFKDVPRHQQTQ